MDLLKLHNCILTPDIYIIIIIITYYSSLHTTAGITLFFFLVHASDYSSIWQSSDDLVSLFIILDLLSSTLPFLFSVFYHTFMPHISGSTLYKRLLKLDIFGVWFATTFGSLCPMYITLYCMPTIRKMYILAYFLLSLIVLYYLIVLDCKRQRVVALTMQFSLRSLILLVRLTPLAITDISAFYYFVGMNIFSSIGAFINALHIPECWFPGKCDYLLNGHSLMHVMAFLSLAVGRHGSLIDLAWLSSNPSCSTRN